MLQLPELDAEERASLRSMQPDSATQALASRLQQRLVAALGTAAMVTVLQGKSGAQDWERNGFPEIRLDDKLAAAWLGLRFGGSADSEGFRIGDSSLLRPLESLVRRALAESVINHGSDSWPQAMKLQITIGGSQGTVEILWNSAQALSWAQRAIRGKA